MKKINNQWYTDKQYIDLLEKKIKELEEENKKLKEDYDILDKFDDKNIDDYKKLEEENETLKKEYLSLNKKCEKLKEENKKLKEENQHIFANVNDDELLRSNAMNWAEANELRQRIDKAINYIENNKQILIFADLRKDGTNQYTIECDVDDLLDILKGEE